MDLTKQQTQLIGSLAAFSRKGESISVIGDGTALSFYGTGLNLCARASFPSDLVVEGSIPTEAAKRLRTARTASLTDALTVDGQVFTLGQHDSPPGWNLWRRADDASQRDLPLDVAIPASAFAAVAKIRTGAPFSICWLPSAGSRVIMLMSTGAGADIDVLVKGNRP